MRIATLFLLFATLTVVAASQSVPVNLEPNQTAIQVNGIVCSFCAYGTEKNLSKLNFLDRSQFGNDGVLIDIQSHRITLAIQSGREVEVDKIYHAIKKGGYDPIEFYLRLDGEISKDSGRFFLTSRGNGQAFELLNHHGGSEDIKPGAIGILDARRIPSIKSDQPIPITVFD
jgi:hypothetical protein